MRKIKLITVIIMMLTCVKTMGYVKTSLDILVDGKTRNMVVFTPTTMEDNLPLMIVTHGMNQSPEYQYDADKLYTMIDKEKFVVAYLRSNGTMWDTGGTSDQRFVEQTIGEMYALYKIDAHRVYWSGFSMGSMLMYHCMHNMTKKIAVFCPCSGIQFSESPWNKVKGPINLIHCHAKDDSVFPLSTYDVHSYVENMSKVNGENSYKKVTGYTPKSGATPGDKEVWTNADGYKVELFMYNWGDHNPSSNNAYEFWNFCKNIRLENIDPIPTPEKPKKYEIDLSSEITNRISLLGGRTLFVTDTATTNYIYGNSSLDSPQNLRSGSCKEIGDNEFCWLLFKRVTDAQTSTSGYLFTLQVANASGETYNLWSNEGYVNTPPGSWCLFALGLNSQYGQDAKNYGLWKVEYDAENGYTIQNVGAAEAGEPSYFSPSFTTPQQDKQYLRIFRSLSEKTETGIEALEATPVLASSSAIYDLMGRRVTTPRSGGMYIRNGKKFVMK